MKEKLIIIIVFLFVLLPISFGGWKLSRWINWKFSYGNKVEQRIEQLEQRIEKLEQSQR